jgi:hypothetical protein
MRLPLLLALAFSVAACSGLNPRGPAGPDPGEEAPAPGYPVYETFDPSGYDAAPDVPEPVDPDDIEHDVPERVMEGRVTIPGQGPPPPATEPVPTEVEGYRVQVFSSQSRDAAERVRADALAWWTEVRSEPDAPGALAATVSYQQPYYRVRLGAFETREAADEALALVRRRFSDAYVVPDVVTVLRPGSR